MKKIISFLLCLALVMTLTLPAMATEDDAGSHTPGQSEGAVKSGDTGNGSDNSGSSGNGSDNPGNSGDGSDNSGNSGSGSDNSGSTGSGSDATQGTVSEGHSHTWVKVTVPATCVEEGGIVVMCSTCEAIESVVVSPKVAHTYDNACDPDCNVCKATREVKHKFSTAWDKNSRKHWHTCSVCGAKDGESDHFPGPAATEEQDQFCLTCGLLMTPRKVHTHKYGSDWSVDETGHWYACASCEEKKDFAYHEYDNLCDPDCNVCGFASPTAHSWDETYTADETGHWTVCVLCGEKMDAAPHTPAESAAEDEALLCAVCGYELEPAKVHVHEFVLEWDEQNHWNACECGETSDMAAHSWDEGAEDQEQGVVTFRCTACDAQRSESVPEAGFPWMIVLIGALVAILGCGIALIFLLKPKKGSGKFAK